MEAVMEAVVEGRRHPRGATPLDDEQTDPRTMASMRLMLRR